MRACRNSRKDIQHPGVYFTGICLSGNRIAALESHFLSNHGIDPVDGLLVSVKQFQETCLCSCGSLGAQKFQASQHIFQILQVHEEFLSPECGAFSHCCGLRRLEMSKRQRRLRFIFIREPGKFSDYIDQFLSHQLQRFRHHDNIRIITHIAGGCSEMDDTFCFGALYAVCIHMGHNVMTHLALSLLRNVIIDIVRMFLQFVDLLLSDVQTQFFLRLRQSDPQLSPGAELHVRRKNVLHLPACIAFRKRAYVSVCTHSDSPVLLNSERYLPSGGRPVLLYICHTLKLYNIRSSKAIDFIGFIPDGISPEILSFWRFRRKIPPEAILPQQSLPDP